MPDIASPEFRNAELWRVWCWCIVRMALKGETQVVSNGPAQVAVQVGPGQFAYQRKAAAESLGLSESTTRNHMAALMRAGRVHGAAVDNLYTLVTVADFARYAACMGGSRTTPPARKPRDMPPVPPELDTPEFRAKWDEWLEYRRTRKPAVTPAAAARAFAALASVGVTRAIATIEESITNDYQGLFPKRAVPAVQGSGKGSAAGVGVQDFSHRPEEGQL